MWMETYSGKRFSLDTLDFNIIDVIVGISRINRYNGQYSDEFEFYTVAEHSVLMADYLASRGYDMKTVRTALCHDLPEGLIGDVVRPIKQMPELNCFKLFEDKIYNKLAVELDLFDPIPKIVHDLDSAMIAVERRSIMNDSGAVWMTDNLDKMFDGLDSVIIRGWCPMRARQEFINAMERYK